MENTKVWNPKENHFALLLPPMAHKPNEGIDGIPFNPRFLVMGENIKNGRKYLILGQNQISSPIFNILPHYEKPRAGKFKIGEQSADFLAKRIYRNYQL
jgi:hypothetical protein